MNRTSPSLSLAPADPPPAATVHLPYRTRLPLHGRHPETRPRDVRRCEPSPAGPPAARASATPAREAEAARHAALAGCRGDGFWWF